MPKKILIVSTSFYPLNSPRSFRTTELVKEFSRQGHDLTIVTPKDQKIHAKFEEDYNVKIIDLKLKKNATFRYTGNIKIISLLKRVLNRLLQVLFEYPDIQIFFKLKNSLKGLNNFDLLISIATPHQVHWGISRVWRKKKTPLAKKWIADCGDPYVGRENDSFPVLLHFHYIEKWFCNKVDYITVPTEGSISGYFPVFRNKIKVIPQGFNFQEVEKIVANAGQNTNKPDEISFAYAGLFIPGKRDPSEFLKFILSTNYQFKFHIYTQSSNLVLPFVEDDRIVLHDFIPRNQLLIELSRMYFLVNFANAGSKQTPSKLIDYAILKKPILNITTGISDFEIVDSFFNKDYSNGMKIDNISKYKIENVAKQFEDII